MVVGKELHIGFSNATPGHAYLSRPVARYQVWMRFLSADVDDAPHLTICTSYQFALWRKSRVCVQVNLGEYWNMGASGVTTGISASLFLRHLAPWIFLCHYFYAMHISASLFLRHAYFCVMHEQQHLHDVMTMFLPGSF